MKINILFFLFLYIDIFFQNIICFLIVGMAGDTNILTVRMVGYDQIFDFFEFFIKDVFAFIWRIICPNINNDVVGLFFRFRIKWNIRSSVFDRTCIFLLLESFASLKPAVMEDPVINVVLFLHSSDYLGGSISNGFDTDLLILALSVSVYANSGWEKII